MSWFIQSLGHTRLLKLWCFFLDRLISSATLNSLIKSGEGDLKFAGNAVHSAGDGGSEASGQAFVASIIRSPFSAQNFRSVKLIRVW